MTEGRLLGIYLNDHLAGATAGVHLARRSLRSNPDGELGAFLARLVRELEEDRRELERVMASLGVPRSRVKVAGGVVAERVGRLKRNGRIVTYSPLSRLLELEGLVIGVEGKLSLWRNLCDAAGVGERVPEVDLDRLMKRAEDQLVDLSEHRLEAARRAFAPPR